MTMRAARRTVATTAAVVTALSLFGAGPAAGASTTVDPLSTTVPAGQEPATALAAVDADTETLVEEAVLEVADAGTAEPGVLDAAEESAAHTDEAEAPTDIVVAESPREAAAEAVVVGLTEPIEVPASQVSALGVTWAGDADGVQVDVRTRAGEDWHEWLTLDLEDPGDAEEGDGAVRHGTAPYIVTDDAVVQVRVLGVAGARPADLRLTLVGVGTRPIPVLPEAEVVARTEDDAPATQSAAPGGLGGGTAIAGPVASRVGADVDEAAGGSLITAPRPAIRLRGEWGARAFRDGEPEIRSVQGAVIHHTVTANDYAASQVPAILRSIQAYHMDGRDWSDIGYNFLVDRFGTIWEGRQGGVELPIRGVHASEANSVSTGISVIGRHDTAAVPTAARNAVTRLVAWKLAIHSVPVGATFTLNSIRMTNVIGHRDVPTAQTACPGTYLYGLLPAIRSGAASLQSFRLVPNNRAVTGTGAVDVLVTGSDPSALSINGDLLASGVRIGHGWLPMDHLTIGPSLLGGARRDIVARERSTGRLWVYRGNGSGGFLGRTGLGYGWGVMTHVLSPGDFDGDGRGDLMAIDGAGRLWLYSGRGNLTFAVRRQVGNGWGIVQAVSTTSDITGDRRPDLVAVLTNGEVRIYPGAGGGAFGKPVTIGRVSEPIATVLVPGDLTLDGHSDVLLRAQGGTVLLLASNGSRFRSPVAVDESWPAGSMLLSGVGWRGTSGRGVLAVDGATGELLEHAGRRTVGVRSPTDLDLPTTGVREVAVVGDAIGSALADVVTLQSDGRLLLHESRGDGQFAAPREVATGWTTTTQIVGVGDFDLDGAPSLVATRSDGKVLLFSFAAARDGSLLEGTEVGQGFGAYRLIAAPDWDANGGSTVLALHTSTGALRAFTLRPGTSLLGGATVGVGWGIFSDVVAVSDVLHSGAPALLARRPDGTSYLYYGNGNNGFGTRAGVARITLDGGAELR